MRWHTAAIPALVLALGACSDGGTTPPPEPGMLLVRVASPYTDDGALVLTLNGPGPITGVVAAPGTSYVVHSRVAAADVRVAVFGAVASGDLVRFNVPDIAKSGSYQATLTEAADRGNALRASNSGYTLSVIR